MSDLRKAAEMALEALRNAEVVYMEQLNAMYALQEALAHPEQGRLREITRQFVGVKEDGSERWVETEYRTVTGREWVGLPSDEEILEISKCAWGESELKYGRDDHRPFYIAFARAIEAKLKEKNT